ncbi:hypothetical protein CEXT_199731, partial [Caerostris extrusa]
MSRVIDKKVTTDTKLTLSSDDGWSVREMNDCRVDCATSRKRVFSGAPHHNNGALVLSLEATMAYLRVAEIHFYVMW